MAPSKSGSDAISWKKNISSGKKGAATSLSKQTGEEKEGEGKEKKTLALMTSEKSTVLCKDLPSATEGNAGVEGKNKFVAEAQELDVGQQKGDVNSTMHAM